MPVSPPVLEAIRAVSHALASQPSNPREGNQISRAISDLFKRSEKIVADAETLDAVLELAVVVEAYRGKRSQYAVQEFAKQTAWLVYLLKERLPTSKENPELFPKEDELPAGDDIRECLGKLADHTFERVQGPRVRSRHAASLRGQAWECLGLLADIRPRNEHLAFALKVAADVRAAEEERMGAIGFLVRYWESDEPDEATISVLHELEEESTSRNLLVGVMQAQIDLGINDEFGALLALEQWDDGDDD